MKQDVVIDLLENVRKIKLTKPQMLWSNNSGLYQVLIKLFLLKIPYFKNRPKDSNLFLRSLIITFLFIPILVLISFIFINVLIGLHDSGALSWSEISIKSWEKAIWFVKRYPYKISVAWIPVLSFVYWNLRQIFADQWKYCAEIYNRIAFEHIDVKNPRELLFQRCTLGLDLLQMDLYAHKSFYRSFNFALEMSVRFVYATRDLETIKKENICTNIWARNPCKGSADAEIDRFEKGKGSVEQAEFYIGELQNFLFDELSRENSKELISNGF